MPLTLDQTNRAKAIVRQSADAAAFRRSANASDIPWWRAEKDAAAIAAEAHAIPEVQALVKTYCRRITWGGAGAEYIRSQVVPLDRKGRANWLQYFLMEVKTSFLPGKDAADDLVNELLNYKRMGSTEIELKHGTLENVPDAQFRSILTRLLTWGFDKIPGDSESLQSGDTTLQQLSDYVREITGDEQYKYAWRCDSRSFADIVDSEGFLAKARSETFAKNFGMREAWHPFSDPNVRRFMWFRKGQNDNCLFSVVSIAKAEEDADWRSYLPFPLLKDVPWEVKDKTVMCKVDGKWSSIRLGVSSSWLYLFVMSNLLVLDTGKLQGKEAFPEQGAAGIPMENIYGAIRFVRIFHGAAGDSPSTRDGERLDEAGLSAMPVEIHLGSKHQFMMAMRWGTKERNKVADVFQAAATSALSHVRWKSTGFEKIGPSFTLGGKQVELSLLSFKELRD